MTEGDIHIRRAVPTDCDTLTDLAHASKRYWKYPEEWIESWKSALTITDVYVADHLVFIGEMDYRTGGFYALVETNGVWELDHLWIHPDVMGQGLGRALFSHAISRLDLIAPGADLTIESDPNAESFYLKMGAKRIGTTSTQWGGLKRSLPVLRYAIADVRVS